MSKQGATSRDGSKLSRKVYLQIRADIFDFRLVPGARFSENAIAARARVSRTPVREALFRLQREGYLEVHAKSGWSVRPLDFNALDQLYDVRVILECEAVRKLCGGDPRPVLGALARAWARVSSFLRCAAMSSSFGWSSERMSWMRLP